MTKNIELAYEALDYIREHPEEWDQASYTCGSTACFAGRASLIAGIHPTMIWIHTARHALGWSDAEAESVFWLQTRDFDVLENAVKRVLNGEISAGEIKGVTA